MIINSSKLVKFKLNLNQRQTSRKGLGRQIELLKLSCKQVMMVGQKSSKAAAGKTSHDKAELVINCVDGNMGENLFGRYVIKVKSDKIINIPILHPVSLEHEQAEQRRA